MDTSLNFTHVFAWLKNGLYEHLFNRRCRIIVSHRGKCLVEFENGEKTITLIHALRKIKGDSK